MEDVDTTAPAPEAAEAPKWAPETETEARALGWKAPDEWKGEIPSGYIDDPNRYLERAESFTPFRKLREKNDEALRRIEAVAAKQVERERAQHQEALAKIKAEKIAAVEVGDVDAYKALETREEAVRRQADAPSTQPTIPPDQKAALDQWSVGKDWLRKDPIKTQAAVAFHMEAVASGLTDPKAQLDYVDKRLGDTFVDLAPKSRVIPNGEPVEAGLTFGGGSQVAPFDKLPKEAKEAFKKFVDRGVFADTKADRAQYAEDYNAA